MPHCMYMHSLANIAFPPQCTTTRTVQYNKHLDRTTSHGQQQTTSTSPWLTLGQQHHQLHLVRCCAGRNTTVRLQAIDGKPAMGNQRFAAILRTSAVVCLNCRVVWRAVDRQKIKKQNKYIYIYIYFLIKYENLKKLCFWSER